MLLSMIAMRYVLEYVFGRMGTSTFFAAVLTYVVTAVVLNAAGYDQPAQAGCTL